MKSKKELFNKLSNLKISDLEKLKLEKTEIDYIKTKLLNDKIGLKINYKEYDEKLIKNYMILKEIDNLGINVKKDKPNNILIEGDNYYALKALQATRTKVDVIYIDPPYNTGKEFIYNDDFSNDNKVVGSDDPHKHSKWLSFMKKRLELSKELLSDSGVIFVSIDDNEQAYLKVLMDEIFGEENFITSFIWERTHHSNKNNSGKKVFRNVDYIHSYTKSHNKLEIFTEGKQTDFGDAPLFNKSNRLQKLTFPKNKVFIKKDGKFNEDDLIIEFNSRWSQSKIYEEIKLGTTFIIKGQNNKAIRAIYHNNKEGYKIPNQLLNTSSVFIDNFNYVTTENGTSELKKILGEGKFPYPKPHELIKYLIKLKQDKNIFVLDFFAGSGTTAQAVMELNDEDGGNRRFILVTNNEMNGINTDENPEKGIARAITRERIFRVIKGKGSKNEEIKWEYSDKKKSLENNSVSYLKVELLNKIKGEFEDLDNVKGLFKREFGKEIDIIDLRMQEKNE